MESLANLIFTVFKSKDKFSLKELYEAFSDKPNTTLRARICDNLGVKFEKIAQGIYCTKDDKNTCLLMEDDGRDLSMFEDQSIDCIITDHPWDDKKSNIGGGRKFALYNCFNYTLEDFKEKARVLKDGAFLVEIIPSENESNYKYLYQIKQYAEECGLLYYSKVPWKKGTFVSNTGRKAKNTQDVMIFSKGKARSLRLDAKKTKETGTSMYMSGTAKMLLTEFNHQYVSRKERIHQAEIPVALIEDILDYVTVENEIVLDQFAGSGSVGVAALNKGRSCILKEIAKENIDKIVERFKALGYDNQVVNVV